jgi:hypothetical protein
MRRCDAASRSRSGCLWTWSGGGAGGGVTIAFHNDGDLGALYERLGGAPL